MKKALGILLLALLFIGIMPSIVTIPAASQADINTAIEKGLAYLNSTQASDGSWGPFSSFPVACTAMAVLAFENQGHYGWNASDPYTATVKNGLDWLFTNGQNITIDNQPAGDPDTNRNGIGVCWSPDIDPIYQTPMVLMAIVASQAPTNVTNAGPLGVRTYYDIAVDIVDYLAWGQCDAPSAYRGGWRYDPNDGDADNSNSQWPVLGLMAAELWGIKAPDFVKNELAYWTTADQNLAGSYSTNYFYGAFNYYLNVYTLDSIAESATGILELTYCGYDKTYPNITAAEGYIDRDWNTSDGSWRVNLGNLYGMYAVMKSCRLATPTPIQFIANYIGSPSVEWYNGTGEYVDSLVTNQSSDGSWTDWVAWAESDEAPVELTSAWGVLILELVPVRVTYTLTVTVEDAATLNPIAGAAVQAVGPQTVSGNTGDNGHIVFNSIQAGNYLATASASGYSPSLNNPISVTNNTAFTINLTRALVDHDVAVTNVASSKTVVGQGYSAPINVTVANLGSYAENFNVSIYSDRFYDQFDVWNYTGAWRYFNPKAAEGYVSVSGGTLHVSGYYGPPYQDGGLTTIKEFNYPITVETKIIANSADHSPALRFGPWLQPGCITIQYDSFGGGWHASYIDTTGEHDIVWGGSISGGTWYTLELVVNETNFKVYLNDAPEVNSNWSPPQEYPKTISLVSTYGSFGSGDFDWVKIETVLQTKAITLTNGDSATLAFVWNTTGFAKGNYTLSAYAWPIPGENNTADNNFTDGLVVVAMVGDLTGPTPGVPDGKVDIRDIALVAKAFGSRPGDPLWNWNCDINNDGIINIKDIAIVAKHFGEIDP